MKWVTSEESALLIESHRKSTPREDNRTMIKFMILCGIIASFAYGKAHAEEICCPYCENLFYMHLELEPYEARECPGAGWYCNNCDMFQSQGQKCIYCKWPRYKKK